MIVVRVLSLVLSEGHMPPVLSLVLSEGHMPPVLHFPNSRPRVTVKKVNRRVGCGLKISCE